MSSSYSRNIDNYEDVRKARRRSAGSEARVRDVSYTELQRIRKREIASMQQPLSNQALVPIGRSRTWDAQSDANASDNQSSHRRSQYAEDKPYDDRHRRRRESAPGYGDGERDRRRRSDRERDAQGSNQRQQRQRQLQSKSRDASEDSQERRLFDRTSDGFISAAAGAAFGAITARHFAAKNAFAAEAEEGRTTARVKVAKNWKTIGGAVLGAAAFNMAEAQIQNYFLEEKREQMENMQVGGELAGEMVGAVAPDVL